MRQFDHEKLKVYQQAINFVVWATDLLEVIPKSMAVHDQLDRASTFVLLNAAEGNGEFTPKDRCKYFDIARGSALESAACLDVLLAKRKIDPKTATEGKAILIEVVSMLVGLIRSNSPDRNV